MAFSSWHITEAMLMYGGNFVQCLAKAYRAADENNQRKLAIAFPEYFKEYKVLAEKLWSEGKLT